MRRHLALALALLATPAAAAPYAVVAGDGTVQNIIEWDGAAPLTPPSGTTLTPATPELLDAWNAQHPAVAAPPVPALLTKSAFLARFTAAELTAVSAAARSNDTVNVWLITAQAADMIDLANPETKSGLDALVSAGIITADREREILTP